MLLSYRVRGPRSVLIHSIPSVVCVCVCWGGGAVLPL
jgi:hypothetical protein